MSEKVNHPAHYNQHPAGIECIQIAEHLNFNLGCAFKYLWRAGSKEGVLAREDLEKALWYVKREKERVRSFMYVHTPNFDAEFTQSVINAYPNNIGLAMYAIMNYAVENPQAPINFIEQAIQDVDN
jgi:hypothetical protein